MTTETLARREETASTLYNGMTPAEIDVVKQTVCKGATDEELRWFLAVCRRTGLNPLARQIYAIKRKSKGSDGQWRETLTIQTGIDGYRLTAERSGDYVPGPEPTYTYDAKGNLESATAYVKKYSRGEWHIVSATARWTEYCQKTRDGDPSGQWATMPHLMLAKCAEALALRKAFPAELSGLYTNEEMGQADNSQPAPRATVRERPRPALPQANNVIEGEVVDAPRSVSPKPKATRAQVEKAYNALVLAAIDAGVPKEVLDGLTLPNLAEVSDDLIIATGKDIRDEIAKAREPKEEAPLTDPFSDE